MCLHESNMLYIFQLLSKCVCTTVKESIVMGLTDIPPDVLLVTEKGDVSITSLPELTGACVWWTG